MDHVWSIAIFRPDVLTEHANVTHGNTRQKSHLWLQSYIDHYSLEQWMAVAERRDTEGFFTEAGMNATLDKLDALVKKSQAPSALQGFAAWTDDMNALYNELFHVNVVSSMARRDITKLNSLSLGEGFRFKWDIACGGPNMTAIGEQLGNLREVEVTSEVDDHDLDDDDDEIDVDENDEVEVEESKQGDL